jgi:hypothetical protein
VAVLNTASFTPAARAIAFVEGQRAGVDVMVPQSDRAPAFCRICGPGLRQQFPNCAHLKPRRQALMNSRPPHGQEDRVPMIRWIATVTAAAVLSAGLTLLRPAAHAAPQSTLQSAPQSAPQPAPSPNAVSPLPLTPASTPSRKPHNVGARSVSEGNLIRGSDTLSLVAMLPWWRADESRLPGSDPGELESPVLTACDVWLGFPFATADAQSLTVRLSLAQHADALDQVANRIRIIEPGELNEIDLTAPDEPQNAGPSWLLRGLLGILGGALAAFTAVRYLAA